MPPGPLYISSISAAVRSASTTIGPISTRFQSFVPLMTSDGVHALRPPGRKSRVRRAPLLAPLPRPWVFIQTEAL
ncbi:MAG: hypothetical protein DMD85_18185 [Candidatus Rokuibacteriota bacterium]|nr:MAG: hypothetical protein DMD85_18185 [Candidatus Rokubacteria bacterium]